MQPSLAQLEPQQQSFQLGQNDDGEKSDRQGFIRKVYAILSMQLGSTAMAITCVMLSDETVNWM
mgnify:CR=1 FL=1